MSEGARYASRLLNCPHDGGCPYAVYCEPHCRDHAPIRVGDYVADYSPLTAEEIAAPLPDEDEALMRNSKPINRRP